jgi:hypothetical protein
MIVWLIERGWVRLVLLVLMGAMVLGHDLRPTSTLRAAVCCPQPGRGLGRAPMPQAPARQGGEARAARTGD